MTVPAAPAASSAATRKVMQANRKRDTQPELRLGLGLTRFRRRLTSRERVQLLAGLCDSNWLRHLLAPSLSWDGVGRSPD
jgi:hypothetical protein